MPEGSTKPPSLELPGSWAWGEFLVEMGWTDRRTLDEQFAWFVHQQYVYYGLKQRYGYGR